MGEDTGPMNRGNLYDEQQRIIRELRDELATAKAERDAAREVLSRARTEMLYLHAQTGSVKGGAVERCIEAMTRITHPAPGGEEGRKQ